MGKWFVKDLRNVIGSAGADTPEPSIAHQIVGPNLNLFYLSPSAGQIVEVYRTISTVIIPHIVVRTWVDKEIIKVDGHSHSTQVTY